MASKLVSVLQALHGDPFELLELLEKVFDEMPPLVHLGVMGSRRVRV